MESAARRKTASEEDGTQLMTDPVTSIDPNGLLVNLHQTQDRNEKIFRPTADPVVARSEKAKPSHKGVSS